MKFTTVALLWTLLGITHCEHSISSGLDGMSGKMYGESSRVEAEQRDYEQKAYASVLSFKRGQHHMAGGILLTLKHALAVLNYIIYLDTKSSMEDVIVAGLCFEPPPTRYRIKKLSYNRKDYPDMSEQQKKYEFGIVTLKDEVIETSHVSPKSIKEFPGCTITEPTFTIELSQRMTCEKLIYPTLDDIASGYRVESDTRNFDRYTAGKLLFLKNRFLGIAVENQNMLGSRYTIFLKLESLHSEIKNWLWKNSKAPILGDWLSDEEKTEWSTSKPYEYQHYVLWQGRDKHKNKLSPPCCLT